MSSAPILEQYLSIDTNYLSFRLTIPLSANALKKRQKHSRGEWCTYLPLGIQCKDWSDIEGSTVLNT
jgi:hypothetical protein